MLHLQFCTQEKMDFVAKIFNKSGISSNMTAIPASILPVYSKEPKTDLNSAQAEAKMVYGQVINEVLCKTGESWLHVAEECSCIAAGVRDAGAVPVLAMQLGCRKCRTPAGTANSAVGFQQKQKQGLVGSLLQRK
jgi:hypothetical protein